MESSHITCFSDLFDKIIIFIFFLQRTLTDRVDRFNPEASGWSDFIQQQQKKQKQRVSPARKQQHKNLDVWNVSGGLPCKWKLSADLMEEAAAAAAVTC